MSYKKYIKGYIGETNAGLKYIVLDYKYPLITIKFLETGYITQVDNSSICSGYIKDKLRPNVCGVGCLGYSDPPHRSKEYILWKGIIERCYNPKRRDYLYYGAKGVTVCDRWKRFDYFLADLEYIDGYNRKLFLNNEIELDKDIKQKDLAPNQKVYSLETCTFIDKHTNRSLAEKPMGKSYNIIAIKDDVILQFSCPIREVSKQLGIKTQYINRILKGGAKSHQGWTFKYCD